MISLFFDETYKHTAQSDYAIVKFECPVVEGDVTPIKKCGPALRTEPNAITSIKSAGFDCVTLANNHFRDYGDEGCFSTINELNKQKVDFVGGGENIQKAQQVLYKEMNSNMTKIKKIIHYIFCEPRKFLLAILYRIAPIIPDRLYLKWLFRLTMRRKLNLDNPQTFSEKLQWLKLYNRKPEYTQMVDKYEAKKYVAKLIGEEYIIHTLGVWNSFDEIDFDKLPNQFVLKTTHGGGNTGVVICKDKNTFDKSNARKCLNASLKNSIYTRLREWPYKNVKPRIIAEQYISDAENNDLPDYKFFCFNGEPKLCQVIAGRETTVTTVDWYDKNWDHQPFHEPKTYPFAASEQKRPKDLERMLELAAKLSEGHPFLRVDFYDVKGSILFGELTFFPTSGMGGFDPEEWDEILGSWINL